MSLLEISGDSMSEGSGFKREAEQVGFVCFFGRMACDDTVNCQGVS